MILNIKILYLQIKNVKMKINNMNKINNIDRDVFNALFYLDNQDLLNLVTMVGSCSLNCLESSEVNMARLISK